MRLGRHAPDSLVANNDDCFSGSFFTTRMFAFRAQRLRAARGRRGPPERTRHWCVTPLAACTQSAPSGEERAEFERQCARGE